MKVIVIGGGYAGCGAAATVARVGGEAFLFECSDILTGVGRNGGSNKINGQITLHYEALAMGGEDILRVIDEETLYENVSLPNQDNVSLFNVSTTEVKVKKRLEELGVKVMIRTRVKDVKMDGRKITAVVLNDGTEVAGDTFVDATGGAGPMGLCNKYGNGCSMCNLKCPTYGGRVSIAAKAGVKEEMGKRKDGGIGSMGISVSLEMSSLSKEIQATLKEKGFVVLTLPERLRDANKIFKLAVHLDHLLERAVITNIGNYGRILTGVAPLPLEGLRSIPGLEFAVTANPMAGGNGNNVRYLAITPFELTLKVEGVDNLFVAGDKAGHLMGIVEAVVSGNLAGYNAARMAAGMDCVVMPTNTVLGDLLAYTHDNWRSDEGLRTHFCCNQGPFLQKMRKEGTYVKEFSEVREKVQKLGLQNIFNTKII